MRTNIYWLFLVDTMLHCYFLGAEVLFSSFRHGLDALLVVLCWGIQVTVITSADVWSRSVLAIMYLFTPPLGLLLDYTGYPTILLH